jgi:hypothetical protein
MPDRRNTVIADRRAYPRLSVDIGELKERRRGRRKVRDGEMERIGSSVTVSVYGVLCSQARREGIDLAEHVRRVLERQAGNSAVTNRQPAETRPS